MTKVNSNLIEFPNTLAGMDIGERIRLERRKRKWSQNDLAKAVGVTQGLVSQIENGTNDSSRYLTAIARALDVSPDWLESGKGDARRRDSNAPMSLHYPPLLEDTLAVIADPDGTELVLVVFRDVNGSQVTLKLQDSAARSLARKLSELGK
jgi:transcriptional regulator with XRE-family HTH domain